MILSTHEVRSKEGASLSRKRAHRNRALRRYEGGFVLAREKDAFDERLDPGAAARRKAVRARRNAATITQNHGSDVERSDGCWSSET